MVKRGSVEIETRRILLMVVALLFAVMVPVAKAADPPPNIILILADDLGWTDINCKYDGGTFFNRTSSDGKNDGGEFDSNFYFTPKIAKLSKDGMRFTNAYAGSMNCGPSRACLLTGKYPTRLGIFTNFNKPDSYHRGGCIMGASREYHLPFDEVTIAEALKSTPGVASSHYVSTHIGKSNLCGVYSLPGHNALAPSAPEYGFDYSIHMTHPQPNYYWEHENDNSWWDTWYLPTGRSALCGMTGAYDPYTLWGDPCQNDPNEYLTDSLTIKAINFLDKWNQEYKSEGRPFFLYLPHYAPHDPLQAKEEYVFIEVNWKMEKKIECGDDDYIFDSSGNRHIAFLGGDKAANIVDSVRGNVLSLDGQNNYLQVYHNKGYCGIDNYKGISGNNPRTVSAWIKIESRDPCDFCDPYDMTIISWGSDSSGAKWDVRINEGGYLEVDYGGGQVTDTTDLTDNNWHHVAVTYENDPCGNDIKIYVDGSAVASGDPCVNTGDAYYVKIGDFFDTTSLTHTYFKGLIDDVRIYNLALSDEQIGMIEEGNDDSLGGGRHQNSVYASMLYSLDESVGDIRAKLEDLDIADNTVIIFTSDNGGMSEATDNFPLRGGKKLLYEGGLRVPLIVYWPDPCDPCNPKTPANSTCDFPVTSADFFPTFLEMAQISMDDVEGAYEGFDKATIDGMDITAILKDPCDLYALDRPNDPCDPCDDNAVFFNYMYWLEPYPADIDKGEDNPQAPRAVVRQGDYKLVKIYDPPTNDPSYWSDPCNFNFAKGQLQYDPKTGVSYELYKIGIGDSWSWDPCGIKDYALELDGIVGNVVIPGYKGITGSNSRTVSAWIRTETTNDTDILGWGSNGDGQKWLLMLKDTGEFRVAVGAGNIKGTTKINDGKWYHVAVVLANDGTPDICDANLYVNGTTETTTSSPEAINTGSDTNVAIGVYPGNTRYFDGFIDDVRIYNTALSEDNIKYLFDSSDPNYAPGTNNLVAHWKMDETEGTKVSDDSGNGHDGIFDIYEGNNLCDPCCSDYSDERDHLDDLLIKWLERIDAGMMRPVARIDNDLYASIQEAIDDACDTDEILVYTGIHEENITINKNITITSFDPCNPEIVADTIIWGTGTGSVVTFGEEANCTLKGFTITAGNDPNGGGINGGGYSSSTISKCIIRDNEATTGGGIYSFDGIIENCTIIDNNSLNGGGLADCDGIIKNCIITDNTASVSGGGLYQGNVTITNCTIADNIADTGGGLKDCNGNITNCIIWGNADDSNRDGKNISAQISGGSLTVKYSCIQDDAPGVDIPFGGGYPNHNIDSDPLFVNSRVFYDKTEDNANPTGPASDPCYSPDPCDFLFNIIKVSSSSYADFNIGDIIEYDSDDVLREVTGKETSGGDYIIRFKPPISPETESNKLIYKWPAGTTNVREDYHLQISSPCINAGDPCSVYSGELWPHGHRINMGAYGNTPEASRSCTNIDDVRLMGADWLQGDSVTDIIPYPDGDGIVDLRDYTFLALHWLCHE